MLDVLIVGGSVAGAATAIHLARAGRSVAILERSTGDRRKACGEGLFPRGVRELAALGVEEQVQAHAARIEGVRFHAGQHSATASFNAEGLGVQRQHLDRCLLDQARHVGVDVRAGVTVRSLRMDGEHVAALRTDSGEVTARAIVGADGLQSRMRVQAGLDRRRDSRRYGVSAHIRLPRSLAALVDVYFEDGYEVYVTPVEEHVLNVAVLLRRRAMRTFAGDMVSGYRAILDRRGGAFVGYQLLDEPAAAGPFGVACTRPWRGNLVLVGDAAGFFDAISGEGMSTTLVSARHCAEAIDASIDSGNEAAFARYAARRRALVRNSDALARLSLALASRPALARWSVRNLARKPQTFARLTAVSAGELPARALRPADALALALGI